MNERKYILGTGYYSANDERGKAMPWLFDLWLTNTRQYTKPTAIYVLANGTGPIPPWVENQEDVIWIDLFGNLGHCGDLLNGLKPHQFAGGSIGWLALAMLAYMSESDLLYKEQDALAFGDYVNEMYEALGDRGCVFGTSRKMGAATSLVLIRHKFIPEVVRLYLGTAPENAPDQMIEGKMGRLHQEHPDLFTRYSFGVDRDRPFDVNAPVWYGQKFTPEELLQLRDAGLINFRDMPHVSGTFSNA